MSESDNLSAPLNADTIQQVCRSLGCDMEVVVLPTVESTNTWLLEYKTTSAITLCAAEHQTTGRGRRGKEWLTPSCGVTFSIRLNTSESVARFAGLSLLVGARLCDHLREVGVQQAMLKWPNDVLVNHAKLAGILIETSISAAAESATKVVVGIGINYRRGSEVQLIDQSSIDLDELCGDAIPDRSDLIARVAASVVTTLKEDVPESLQDLALQWTNYDALAGCDVTVQSGSGSEGKQISGRTLGIDPDGGLRVETAKGVEVFHSAEVSVRAG